MSEEGQAERAARASRRATKDTRRKERGRLARGEREMKREREQTIFLFPPAWSQ